MPVDEIDPNDMLSERDVRTRFVPRSDDEEVLWQVVEITGERGSKYKVKWAGADPATGKPWAQSWVAKYDCTDDLVVAWRAKQKKKHKGKRARVGKRSESAQDSRQSGSTGKGTSRSATVTSETGKKTRRLGSVSAEASSSRLQLDSVERLLSPSPLPSPSPPPPSSPPKLKPSSNVKRKRDLENPVTTPTTAAKPSGGRVKADEGSEPSRPQKKRRTIVEVLVPPLSEEDGEDGEPLGAGVHTRASLRNGAPLKGSGGSLVSDASDGESVLPKSKTKEKERDKSVRHPDARSKGHRGGRKRSGSEDEERKLNSRTKTKDSLRREERVSDTESLDEKIQPLPSKSKPTSKRILPVLEEFSENSEEETEVLVLSSKVGPPRGVKRQTRPKSHGKRGPSRTTSQDDPGDESVPRQSEDDVSSSGGAILTKASKSKLTSKRELLTLEQVFDTPEPEVEMPILSAKIGPPRGVKRRQKLSKSRSLEERGSSRTTPREDDPADVPTAEPTGQLENDTFSRGATPILKDPVAVPVPISPKHIPISTPPGSPNVPLRNPILSPGAIARLELFDSMMTDEIQPGTPLVYAQDDQSNMVDTFDPPRIPSPPPSASKTKYSKPVTPNGLVVPETQSSGNSNQSQPLPQPPLTPPPVNGQSPHEPVDFFSVPPITILADSSASPQEIRPPPPTRPPKTQKCRLRFMPHMSPGTFPSGVGARWEVTTADAPPSSIESFTSPQRVDKGKQRAVESDDGVRDSLSEKEGAGDVRKQQTKKTDSELKKRGEELFERNQLVRGAERQKTKTKRLKTINEITNGTVTTPSAASPPPPPNQNYVVPDMQLRELVSLLTSDHSATLESREYSEAKPLTAEEREHLRIELRQEEEESTQEAIDARPCPPVTIVEGPESVPGEDDQPLPLPELPVSPLVRNAEVDPVEQPSLDVQLASVIVQPSQGQQTEMGTDPSPTNQPASSPPFPIPEKLTDSPKRRLGEALSLLNVKSEEIQRLETDLADARRTLESLEAELVQVRQSSEPTALVRAAWEVERAQWAEERSKWESDRSLWEAQHKGISEEKETLATRVAELSEALAQAEGTRAKLSELEAERVAWAEERNTLLSDATQRESEALTRVLEERETERVKWEIERAEWVEEKVKWETERAVLLEKTETLSASVDSLTSSVDSLTSAKASVEKDMDFFREQYMQASGFVSAIRAENEELENKAKIAEGQAQEGVAAIKAMFENRIKALRADVERWKGLSELLQEKDTRTNDGIRQRAALMPELAELRDRLSKEKRSLEIDVRRLNIAHHRDVTRRNRLYFQILVLKKERASLRLKLSQQAEAKAVRRSSSGAREGSHSLPMSALILPGSSSPSLPLAAVDDPEGMDPNDMDPPSQLSPERSFDEPALFPCMWRPQWKDQCQQVFDTKEDLERHVQGHLSDLMI